MEEVKLDRQCDRKTNGSSLVSRHCSLFLNLAQMQRFKTKLVGAIFSAPFLRCCHHKVWDFVCMHVLEVHELGDLFGNLLVFTYASMHLYAVS